MPNPRSDYSNIFEREPLKLPGDARIIVWPVINVEEWDINEPMARTVLPVPQGRSVIPDVPNYAWYDYGMRVGFWRIKEVLDRHRPIMKKDAYVKFQREQAQIVEYSGEA